MTADEALELAKFQRPGVKLVVGAVEAVERAVEPMPRFALGKLPGDATFWQRDIRKRIGFVPHLLAMFAGLVCESATGVNLSDDEWKHLHEASKDRRDAFVLRFIAENKEGV